MINFAEVIGSQLAIPEKQVASTLALIDGGGTVPFIARYRKEATGNLDEIQIRDITHRYEYFRELSERRATVLESISDQGKLSPELKAKIEATLSKTELEDLYLPYKPRRTTRATKARDAGLEPLAKWLLSCVDPAASPDEEAAKFINAEKGIDTPHKALQGASDIVAELVTDDADNRKWMRELAAAEGVINSSVQKEFAKQKTKFAMYYDYHEPVKSLPSHRILAMFRGEKEHVLTLSLSFPTDRALGHLVSKTVRFPASPAAALLTAAAKDGLERLLAPATETEIRLMLRERAEETAFGVFGENLRNLLLAPPAGRKPVLALDPGFRTGCKVVVIDDTGEFLEYQTIFPHEPQKRTDEARSIILALIQRHGVRLIAIGNGTASRETDTFVRETIALVPEELRPVSIVVSEAGASVYSASEVAIREFPDKDLTVRGAVSIGRRLQDSLSELVKIDPKAIGVGQYQHDVNQSLLRKRLEEEVVSCVNHVGVDLNLASEELLKYVAGLTRLTAGRIVKYRAEHGAFSSREEVADVPGIGPKSFEQAAGFLRIPGAANPLDNSAVHPERYAFVNSMAASLGLSIDEPAGNAATLASIEKTRFVSNEIGLPTITDIIAELEKPGRDPRAEFRYATFADSVNEIADLREDMQLEGTVTNVTAFGAFVDIGVHQDGLVHISELSDRYVADPHQVVRVGQVVKVRVLSADTQLKRIALSMKSPDAPSKESGKRTIGEDKTHPRPSRPRKGPSGGSRPHQALRPQQPKQHFKPEDLMKKFGASEKKPNEKQKKLFTVKPKINVKNII